jgi:hypothetical protein
VFTAAWLRAYARDAGRRVSLLLEIALLLAVMVLHEQLPSTGGAQPIHLGRRLIFAMICMAFGLGATIGAFATSHLSGGAALAIPVMLLGTALLVCEVKERA